MIEPFRVDDIHRTALLGMYDDSQPTLDAALAAHAATGVVLCANEAVCREVTGQAALLTAVATAVRAFGTVVVLAEHSDATIELGTFNGLTLAEAVGREGARLVSGVGFPPANAWPVVLLGADTSPPAMPTHEDSRRSILRISWSGWVARVCASSAIDPKPNGYCVLAAIAAAAIGISEAFGAVRARAGSDAGFRTVELNLWNPSGPVEDEGPPFAYAPQAWWLVGLGHLGQAFAWVISWLAYEAPSTIEVVLQDTDRTVPANHSTGILTPESSDGIRKTRLVAEALERAGFDTRILERRLGPDLQAANHECHVALLGVDNLPTRRLTSGVDWPLAVDVGLGSGPNDFSAMLMRRFPGALRSDGIAGWLQQSPDHTPIPSSRAFDELLRHGDACGVVELAGKAVGAAFVGVLAATLAIAESSRELHCGRGFDVLTFDLSGADLTSGPATQPAEVISASLHVPQLRRPDVGDS